MRKLSYPTPDELQRTWARNVLEQRTMRKMTVRTLADMLGADPATVSRWERGLVSIPDAQKTRLAGLFGTHPQLLFPWPAERPPMPKPLPARKVAA